LNIPKRIVNSKESELKGQGFTLRHRDITAGQLEEYILSVAPSEPPFRGGVVEDIYVDFRRYMVRGSRKRQIRYDVYIRADADVWERTAVEIDKEK